MTSSPKTASDLSHINEVLAKYLTFNDKSDFMIGVWAKVFPLLLSSLIAAYSVVTTSFFYGFSGLIDNVSILILLISFLLSLFSISFMVVLNGQILVGLNIQRSTPIYDKLADEYMVQYFYTPIYRDNIRIAIKKTIDDLLSTAFVILFPGGIADIVLGIATNDPEIGVNTIGQVITGIVFTAISVILLAFTVRSEAIILKKTKSVETNKMKSIIEKVQREMQKSGKIRIVFGESDPEFIPY